MIGGGRVDCCCGDYCTCNSGRSFLTKEEKIEMLQKYKDYLDKEVKGVAERIEGLRKAS